MFVDIPAFSYRNERFTHLSKLRNINNMKPSKCFELNYICISCMRGTCRIQQRTSKRIYQKRIRKVRKNFCSKCVPMKLAPSSINTLGNGEKRRPLNGQKIIFVPWLSLVPICGWSAISGESTGGLAWAILKLMNKYQILDYYIDMLLQS